MNQETFSFIKQLIPFLLSVGTLVLAMFKYYKNNTTTYIYDYIEDGSEKFARRIFTACYILIVVLLTVFLVFAVEYDKMNAIWIFIIMFVMISLALIIRVIATKKAKSSIHSHIYRFIYSVLFSGVALFIYSIYSLGFKNMLDDLLFSLFVYPIFLTLFLLEVLAMYHILELGKLISFSKNKFEIGVILDESSGVSKRISGLKDVYFRGKWMYLISESPNTMKIICPRESLIAFECRMRDDDADIDKCNEEKSGVLSNKKERRLIKKV